MTALTKKSNGVHSRTVLEAKANFVFLLFFFYVFWTWFFVFFLHFSFMCFGLVGKAVMFSLFCPCACLEKGRSKAGAKRAGVGRLEFLFGSGHF